MSTMRWKRALVLAIIIAFAMVYVQAVVTTSHKQAAAASWATCHVTQNIHELSNPPTSWPGTRAAHAVTRFTGYDVQTFYTKSGWWDPSWDFYKQEIYPC